MSDSDTEEIGLHYMGPAPPPGLSQPITAPPPSYAEIQFQGGKNLDWIDFVPEKRDVPGSSYEKTYDRFDVLMKQGNEWLAANPTRRVLTGESVEINLGIEGSMKKEKEKVQWVEAGKDYKEKYVRFLRLWTVEKMPDEPPEPQQIGHINIVPQCLQTKDFFTRPSYASYPDTLNAFNTGLRMQPIPGKVINVETQEMKIKPHSGELDPDNNYWKEGDDKSSYFVYVIRVFYAKGQPTYEQLGSVDFTPRIMADRRYEDLRLVLRHARDWMGKQRHIRVTNVQSVNFKIFQPSSLFETIFDLDTAKLDTTVTCYKEDDDGKTRYVRIVRVFYTCLAQQGAPADVPRHLTMKNFLPAQTQGGPGCCETFDFEKTTPTRERIAAWFRVSGALPLSCETVPVPHDDDLVTEDECNFTYDPHKGDSFKCYMNNFRVYFKEPFIEPPLEVLPPLPNITRGENACYLLCCCCCIACGCCGKTDDEKTEEEN